MHLHHIPGNTSYIVSKSIYQECIEEIGKRLDQYSPQRTEFYLIGFGHTKQMTSQNLMELVSNKDVAPNTVVRYSSSNQQAVSQNSIFDKFTMPMPLDMCSKIYRQACEEIYKKNRFSLNMQYVYRESRYLNVEFLAKSGSREISHLASVSIDSSESKEDLVIQKLFGANDFQHLINDLTEYSINIEQLNQNIKSGKEELSSTSPIKLDAKEISKNQHEATTSSSDTNLENQRKPHTRHYNILILIISNDHIDIQETIYNLVGASHKAPLSVIILGVGTRSAFKTLRSINWNVKKQLDSKIQTRFNMGVPHVKSNLQFKGLWAARDVCTFVRLGDYESVEEACEVALSNIPQQVCRFYRMQMQQRSKQPC